jgi:glycogen operon protein
MITGGDEHLRSLHCNNNPYNLDSPGNWLSYSFNAEETNFARRAALIKKTARRREKVVRQVRLRPRHGLK